MRKFFAHFANPRVITAAVVQSHSGSSVPSPFSEGRFPQETQPRKETSIGHRNPFLFGDTKPDQIGYLRLPLVSNTFTIVCSHCLWQMKLRHCKTQSSHCGRKLPLAYSLVITHLHLPPNTSFLLIPSPRFILLSSVPTMIDCERQSQTD